MCGYYLYSHNGERTRGCLTNQALLDIFSNMSDLNEFGEYLKKARQAKGLSLRAVEEVTGVSNAYLSQLEQGKIRQPSPVILHKLSQLYELSYADIMRSVGYPVPGDEETQTGTLAARIGPVTEEEEEELVDYLKFLRSKKKRGD